MGHEAFVFDYLTLAGEKVAKRVANAYVNTVKTVPYVLEKCINWECMLVNIQKNPLCIK